MKRFFFLLLCVFVFSLYVFGQEEEGEGFQPLPRGFRDIVLGMTLEEAKDALKEDVYFNYRGDPDVSLLRKPNETVIECEGAVYISRAYFQFFNRALYIINLSLNTDEVDYYSMYTALTEKYGDPDSLDPQSAAWENENILLSLEKPCTVKYIDKVVFQQLLEEAAIEKSVLSVGREDFINQF